MFGSIEVAIDFMKGFVCAARPGVEDDSVFAAERITSRAKDQRDRNGGGADNYRA